MKNNQLRRNNFMLDSKRIQKTPSGGIRVSAYLARTGLQTYFDLQGNKIVEFRPAEEVFNSVSIESYKGAPITDGHPRNPVDTMNWSALSKGHVSDSVNPAEDKFVRAELLIQDKQTVDDVLTGELKEISCGYLCDLEEFPGELEGEPYDAIQRNIRINHVALLPFGQARGGRDLTVRFDSEGNLIMPETEQHNMEEEVQNDQVEEESVEEATTNNDSEDVQEEAVVNDETTEEETSVVVEDSLERSIDALSARLGALEAALVPKPLGGGEAATEPQAVVVEAVVEPRMDEEVNIDTLVNEKLNLIDAARVLLNDKELTFDGMNPQEIKLFTLNEKKLNIKEDSSEEYINGCFDTIKALEDNNKPATEKVDSIEKQLEDSRKGIINEQSGGLKELQETWAARLNKGDE